MPRIARQEVADFLKEFSVLLDLRGEEVFRVRTYAGAARTFETVEDDLEEMLTRGTLTSLKGVGKGLAELVEEFVRTGTTRDFEALKAATPPGLLDMLRIPGLGPKKIRTIHTELGIDTLEALETAGREGRLSALSGFGKKTQENILAGIERRQHYQDLFRADAALETARTLGAFLADHPRTIRVSPAGRLRRGWEIVEGIDLVLSSDHPAEVARAFADNTVGGRIVDQDEKRITALLPSGMPARLHLVADDVFPGALHHFTGSEEYGAQMRERARAAGLELNEHGLWRGPERLESADETELFAHLDLDFIPPELREGRGEIEAAAQGALPELVQQSDLCGLLHVHSTYSDGSDSIQALAQAARDLGYRYLGVCDHSRSAPYANGLQEDDIRRQHEEIDTLNQKLDDFRIFKGIESDILTEGELDYDDRVLEGFDFVIASVHSRFNMSGPDMTRRVVRAIQHPATTIFGHPTGRLLLEREGYAIDIDAIIEAAAACNVALEINAHPSRLDLDWRHLRAARDAGVRLAINTDAHQITGFHHIRFGVAVARKGWLRREDVINTLETDDLAAFFRLKG